MQNSSGPSSTQAWPGQRCLPCSDRAFYGVSGSLFQDSARRECSVVARSERGIVARIPRGIVPAADVVPGRAGPGGNVLISEDAKGAKRGR
jgi:hypothetical protein